MSKIVVIKCGGSVLNSLHESKLLCENIIQLQTNGAKVILVHGGGPEINKLANLYGIESDFINGMRVTHAPLIDLVHMALIGVNNTKLVQQLTKFGISALGLSGHDNKLLIADYLDFATYGYVGEMTLVNVELLNLLLEKNIVPVIAPLAIDRKCNTLNVNADMVASNIASALLASDLILLSDIDGYYANYPDQNSLVAKLSISDITKLLLQDGKVANGMIPKLQACAQAVAKDVLHAYIINGTKEYQLIKLINHPGSLGTTIIKGA